MTCPHSLAAFVTAVTIRNVGEISATKVSAQTERRLVDGSIGWHFGFRFAFGLFRFMRQTTKGMSYVVSITPELGCTFLVNAYTDVQA